MLYAYSMYSIVHLCVIRFVSFFDALYKVLQYAVNIKSKWSNIVFLSTNVACEY